MIEDGEKQITLSEIYQQAITKALETNYRLPEDLIDIIYEEIVQEISTKCLHENKCIRKIASNIGLEHQVAPILKAAKEANSKRKFSFNLPKSKGLYEEMKFPIQNYKILEGIDTLSVKSKIRRWLEDFGTENDKFTMGFYGNYTEVGNLLDKVDQELNIENQLPEILKHSKTSQDLDEISKAYHYFKVEPIKMKCFLHDPSDVLLDENADLQSYTLSYCDVTFKFPVCRPPNISVTAEADIEYDVTKGVFHRRLAPHNIPLVILNPALAFLKDLTESQLFDKSISETFSHRFKIKIELPAEAVAVREKLKIEVTQETSEHFLDMYNKFEQFTKVLSGQQGESIQNSQLVILYERFPWIEYIITLRRGGVEAANALLKKKPEVLRNLPVDENNALGIAFEELQIAKVMAEAIRRDIKLEHIAGDGNGRVAIGDRNVETPDYVDAVFRDIKTDKLYAVQFKYSDTANNLLDMVARWRVRHGGGVPDPNLPEPLHLDNIQVIGPKDVIQNEPKGDIDHEMHIGEFRVRADDREVIQNFLRENTELLQDIVNSEEWDNRSVLIQERTALERKKEKENQQLQRLKQNLENVRQNNNAQAIEQIENKIANIEESLRNNQQRCGKADAEVKQIEVRTTAKIKERLGPSYIRKVKKLVVKDTTIDLAVQAVTDAIITMVTTSDQELRKYFKGEITAWECSRTIMKNTAIAFVRGGVSGLGFSGIKMLARLATFHGWKVAGLASAASELVGPALMAGMVLYETHNAIQLWKNKEITTAEMEKAIARNVTSSALSLGSTIAAGTLIGGPIGLLVGAGIAIAIAVGDHFLGDKIWSLVFKENPEEAKALVVRKYENLKEDVLKAAYDLFNLTAHATDEEVKEAYKAAVLKYHPDKGGETEKFHAVHAAYQVIKELKK